MAGAIRVNALVVRQQIRRMQQIVSLTKTALPEFKNNSGETVNRMKEIFRVCKVLEADFRKLVSDTATAMTNALAEFENADSSLAGMFGSSLPGVAGAIGSVSVQNPHGVIGTAHGTLSDVASQIGTIEDHQLAPGEAVAPNWANTVFSTTNGIGVTLTSIASAIGHVSVEVGELIDPHIHLSRDLLDFFETHTFDVESFVGTADAELEEPTIPIWSLIIHPVIPMVFILKDASQESLRQIAASVIRQIAPGTLSGPGAVTEIKKPPLDWTGAVVKRNIPDIIMRDPPYPPYRLSDMTNVWSKSDADTNGIRTQYDPAQEVLRIMRTFEPDNLFNRAKRSPALGNLRLRGSGQWVLYLQDDSPYAGSTSARTTASSMSAARAAEQVMCSPEYASGEIGSQLTLGIA